LLTCEDDVATTIVPRLHAAGADLSRVFVIQSALCEPDAKGKQARKWVELAKDLDELERTAKQFQAAAIFIDPLSAYMGGKTDTLKEADVRRVLGPLNEMSARLRLATVGVRHFVKRDTKSTQPLNLVHQGGGSIAFIAAARAAFGITLARHGADKPDPNGPRLLFPIKSNLAPRPPALEFDVVAPDGVAKTTGWRESPLDPNEAMAPAQAEAPEEPSRIEEAQDWLKARLEGGPVGSAELQTAAKKDGLSWRTVRRAKDLLAVRSQKRVGPAGEVLQWDWAL
jgi:putative DNA primase/helicase